jgi:hypothetical protein
VVASARRTVRDKSSFNLIHERMLVKSDIYVAPDDSLHRDQATECPIGVGATSWGC